MTISGTGPNGELLVSYNNGPLTVAQSHDDYQSHMMQNPHHHVQYA